VVGDEIDFLREDKHNYKRPLSSLVDIIATCKLECKLID
jgi:hypothetical protein